MQKRFWGLSDDDSSSEGSPGPLGVHRYPCLIVPEQWFTKTLDYNSVSQSVSQPAHELVYKYPTFQTLGIER